MNNIHYILTVATVSGWDRLGSKWTDSSWIFMWWKQEKWASENVWVTQWMAGNMLFTLGTDLSRCTMGRRQVRGGSVIRWAMFCWESLSPGIDMDVILTNTTYLKIVADHTPSRQWYFLMAVVSFCRIMHPATLQNKMFRNNLGHDKDFR